MKKDSLKQYVNLRQSLLAEKSELETRLEAINLALNSAPKTARVGRPPGAVTVVGKVAKKKKISAAGRAAIAAALKARWAKIKAAKKA